MNASPRAETSDLPKNRPWYYRGVIVSTLILIQFLAGWVFADRVTLDTGNDLEGIVQERGDVVRLQYLSSKGKEYTLRTMDIPRSRVKKIDRDATYLQRYQKIIASLGGIAAVSSNGGASSHGKDSLSEAVLQGNLQLQKNLHQEKERMREAKFYWGWHEGYHWDPNNGWHRWNHQGLYDPFDPNITVKNRE